MNKWQVFLLYTMFIAVAVGLGYVRKIKICNCSGVVLKKLIFRSKTNIHSVYSAIFERLLNKYTTNIQIPIEKGGGSEQLQKYNYFDFDHTCILKGIAIALIIWGHVGKRIGIGSIQWIAGIGVSLFLICSGYGIEASYEKNGLSGYWIKKLWNVIIPFYAVSFVGIFVAEKASIMGLVDILTFRTQWFINYILFCYIIFWAITSVIKDNNKRVCAFIAAFAVWFIIDSLFFTVADAPFLRARQMPSFVLGILMALKKEEMKNLLKSNVAFVANLIIGVVFLGVTNLPVIKATPIVFSNFLSLFTTVPLALFVICLTTKFDSLFSNASLLFIGSISYELFLVHNYSSILVANRIGSLLIFTIITMLLAWTLNKMYRNVKNKFLT